MLTSESHLTSGTEPIPGYVLRERIGMGGFGEVWSVEAPGGLEKAIKLVFGTITSDRAQRELRSLERLRRVHHPFLLTLERFEVIDSRLMIVTERADEGLDQILARCQLNGLPGIPRDELLNYLTEAADALDHLRERYGLQHLDIKPANLLVLSGHMKVADFGLVKDLSDMEQSIVGGLTPTYAAPEVFDGKPSIHSDQYSLAIVYQELLSGQRPFDGKSIAQLATQHVHSPPNLDSLPHADRPVIARALEKNPERRFGSCTELMQRLREASSRPGNMPKPSGRSEPSGDTMVGGMTNANLANVADVVKQVKPVAVGTAVNTALVVGIGGLGADVLAKVRCDLFDKDNVQLRCLLLDTDSEAMESACNTKRASGRLTPQQTMLLPLRNAHDYREETTGRLTAMSRRWVYNVPRSGRTESLRPLGRLALVDHGPQVVERLRNEVKALPADRHCSVYVVASLAGGTGSGMVWDIVHILRALLDESNRADVRVRPLVAIAWADHRVRPLQLASTCAALREAAYFANPEHSYPGDIGAGFPSVPAGRSPLRDAYLITSPDDQRLAEQLCDYLLLDLSPAGSVLENARTSGESNGAGLQIRTVGVNTLNLPGLAGFDRYVNESLYFGIRQLLGRLRDDDQRPAPLAEMLLHQSEVSTSAWSNRWLVANKWNPQDLDGDLCQRLNEVLRRGLDNAPELSGSMILHLADQLFEPSKFAQRDIDALAVNAIQQMKSGMQRMLKSAHTDFAVAVNVLNLIEQQLNTEMEKHRQEVMKYDAQLKSFAAQIRSQSTSTPDDQQPAKGHLIDWAKTRLMLLMSLDLANLFERVADEARETAAAYAEQARRAAGLAMRLRAMSKPKTQTRETLPSISLSVSSSNRQQNDLLMQAMQSVISQVREYLVVNELNPDPVQAAIELTAEATAAFRAEGLEPPNQSEITQFVEHLPQLLVSTRPSLLDCGGQQWRMLIFGDQDQQQFLEPMFQDALQGKVTAVHVPGAKSTYLHEGQNIDIQQTLSRLRTALGHEQVLTDKLMSRADCSW